MWVKFRVLFSLWVFAILLTSQGVTAQPPSPTPLWKKRLQISQYIWKFVANKEKQIKSTLNGTKTFVSSVTVPRSFKRLEEVEGRYNPLPLSLSEDMSLTKTIGNQSSLRTTSQLPIALYEQIFRDLPREPFAVLNNFVPLFKEKKKRKEKQAISNEALISHRFYEVTKTLQELECPHLSSLERVHNLAHLALASRTQTFDRESIDLIQHFVQKKTNSADGFFPTKQYKRQSIVNICDDKLVAMTSTSFAVGSGVGHAPIGEIISGYEVIRFIEFDFSQELPLEEVHIIYEIPKTTSSRLLRRQ